MHAIEFPWAADAPLVRQLTTGDRRHNLLIRCHSGGADRVLKTLMQSCEPPFHLCTLPGPLALPAQTTGTFFLENASALTLAQQIRLQDWMSGGPGQIQMISVVFDPLYPMVEQGQFLEGLFYRLSVVSLDAETR
jgi:transcriptional regulator of acetoin/glycerol metabolism